MDLRERIIKRLKNSLDDFEEAMSCDSKGNFDEGLALMSAHDEFIQGQIEGMKAMIFEVETIKL